MLIIRCAPRTRGRFSGRPWAPGAGSRRSVSPPECHLGKPRTSIFAPHQGRAYRRCMALRPLLQFLYHLFHPYSQYWRVFMISVKILFFCNSGYKVRSFFKRKQFLLGLKLFRPSRYGHSRFDLSRDENSFAVAGEAVGYA